MSTPVIDGVQHHSGQIDHPHPPKRAPISPPMQVIKEKPAAKDQRNHIYSRAYHKTVCKEKKVNGLEEAKRIARAAGQAALRAAGLK